jgi:DNA-binding transcriptional LysR family regulator
MKSRNAILHSSLRTTAPGIYSFPIMRDFRSLTPMEFHKICHSLLNELEVLHQAVLCGDRYEASLKFDIGSTRVGQILAEIEEGLGEYLNGGTLINWEKKHIEVTEAGQLVYEFAGDILVRTQTMLENLHRLQHRTELTIATINAVWLAYGNDLEKAFAEAIPGGRINHHIFGKERYPEKVVADVTEGRADIGITSYPPKVQLPFVLQYLRDTEVCLVFNINNPNRPKWPPQRGPARLDDATRDQPDFRIALHRQNSGSPFAERVSAYIRPLRSTFACGHMEIREGENIAELVKIVKEFPGTITILPVDSSLNELKANELVAYSMSPPMEPWVWGMIYRANTSSQTVKAFVECMRPLFR